MKILIIRLSSIGDILLTSPFIRQVRHKFPQAQIDFVIKAQYFELVQHNRYLNNIFVLMNAGNKSALKLLCNQLKQNHYDIVFDLHNNLRSNYIKKSIHADNIRSIHKEKVKQQVFVYLKINLYQNHQSIPQRYLQTGRDFDVKDDSKGLDIFWQEQQRAAVVEKAKKKGFNVDQFFICFAPGAGFFTKRWPLEYFKALLEMLQTHRNQQIAVIGGKEDYNFGHWLSSEKYGYNFCGELSLLETAVLLSSARGLVSNDSGLMHLAAAAGTPVLAIFGSTVKEWGFFPYRIKSVVVERHGLSCRPCSHIGRNRCPLRHFKCMREIKPEEVYQKLLRLME